MLGLYTNTPELKQSGQPGSGAALNSSLSKISSIFLITLRNCRDKNVKIYLQQLRSLYSINWQKGPQSKLFIKIIDLGMNIVRFRPSVYWYHQNRCLRHTPIISSHFVGLHTCTVILFTLPKSTNTRTHSPLKRVINSFLPTEVVVAPAIDFFRARPDRVWQPIFTDSV